VLVEAFEAELVALRPWAEFHRKKLGFTPSWEASVSAENRSERRRKGREQRKVREHIEVLLNEGIKSHIEEIIEMYKQGEIACVVYKPLGESVIVARSLGWDGERAFALSDKAIAAFAMSDEATRRWLAEAPSEDKVKIFVISGHGTLLVNYGPDGFSFEPGSTDREFFTLH
jgi:hypothetical protein